MRSRRTSTPPPDAALAPRLAAAVVFSASGGVLVLEILAVRLLAPYVGLTLETYTTIIGVVLAGISAGSWLGGRLADAHVRGLGSLTDGPAVEGLVLLGLLAFFPPAAALSTVTPIVAKLQLASLGETGTVVGRLDARPRR